MKHADHAYDLIRTRIVRCELPPGSRFTEAAISEEIELGRTPVREALVRLRREGLVTVSARAGCRVTDVTLRDVHELCELREAVEGRIAELAALRLKEGRADLACLEAACEQQFDIDVASLEDFLDVNRAFHAELGQLSGNRRLIELQRSVIDEFDRLFWLGLPASPHVDHMRDEHRAVVEAIRSGSDTRARAAVLAHCRTFESVVTGVVLASDAVEATSLAHVYDGSGRRL